MSRPIVHVVDPVHPDVVALLQTEAEVWLGDVPFPSACDAVIVRTARVGADEISACPNLKVIGKHGAGLDAIDLGAASARAITVLSTPGANAASVSDLAIGFALALIRQFHTVTLAVKAGTPLSGAQKRGFDLAELKAGIFGLGAIGKGTAQRLIGGFGAPVQAFDPGVSDQDWPAAIARCDSLERLLETSDILFVHAPLLPATRNALDAPALARMRPGSFLVNCARGGIVDETALAAALRSGHIAGAAADVFAVEPPSPENPLMACEGFLATPHIGGSTNGALVRVGQLVAEQVLSALRAPITI